MSGAPGDAFGGFHSLVLSPVTFTFCSQVRAETTLRELSPSGVAQQTEAWLPPQSTGTALCPQPQPPNPPTADSWHLPTPEPAPKHCEEQGHHCQSQSKTPPAQKWVGYKRQGAVPAVPCRCHGLTRIVVTVRVGRPSAAPRESVPCKPQNEGAVGFQSPRRGPTRPGLTLG